jgi:hypothetical protein
MESNEGSSRIGLATDLPDKAAQAEEDFRQAAYSFRLNERAAF